MNREQAPNNIFTHGSTWLRADFHLHTRADKEFAYAGKEDRFVSDYVAGLKSAGIRLGIIANHNKFDAGEFKALRKRAGKEEIFLLAGVELSVSDGAHGIHTLIVFSEQWLEKGQDYISPFIAGMFPGKATSEYENENGRSDKNILQVVEELEKTGRDYFLIFAHVEQKSGLWREMSGGRLGDFSGKRYTDVRQRTLGFQKVRTDNNSDEVSREKVKGWLKGWYPAEVEGSDCKTTEEIGKGKKGFIKLGAFSFDAVKYALQDHESRIAPKPYEHGHSRIRSIRFTGGTLSGQKLHFSPELNTLIGIRGSGKSSILEVLRYALAIPYGEEASDIKYKENLVGFTMGSGGKVDIEAIGRQGQQYTIRRIWKESYSEVLIDGILQPGISMRETVLRKPIYFGQKDLSINGEGFEKDLVDKLLGPRLDRVRYAISQQKRRVMEATDRLHNVANVQEQIAEQKKIRQDTEHRLNFYVKHDVEEKLQKRLAFDGDVRMMKKGAGLIEEFVSDLENLLARHEDDIRNFKGFQSKHNSELFRRFYENYEIYIALIDRIKSWLADQVSARRSLSVCRTELAEIRRSMAEEFAEIERKLKEELESSGKHNISSEEFLSLKQKLASANQLLALLETQSNRKEALQDALLAELKTLNDLWYEEFNLIKTELDKVGSGSSPISIISEFKEDKESFLGFMKDIFKGSGIRVATYQGIVDRYSDFADIYRNLENAKTLFGSNPQILIDLFWKNLKSLLTYQTPNRFAIHYRGKKLQNHSLGQRASALILFVLSQKENDVIIIDQPEDDLDNQTIYEDVIKLIREMKPEVQFIFATHNPNIPVLGDAELVHACSFTDDKESVCSGSVDSPNTQKAIVDIMEGGKEAFDRRREIYRLWKP